ncbi:NAD-dependent epimerase/dehydratase family protein [Streptomyces sp. NPDC088747]|uniref:NAD-dependent epimerase/dehydratase family protein n=1 Tax=Streptomyces sp. NPDC088747 TaxID=3365886 RepID=UPI00381AE08E
MKVLVLGATGYAGFHVARALRQEGHTVLGLTRDAAGTRAQELVVEEIHPVEGRLSDPDSYRTALEEADAVVCAALDMDDPLGSDRKLFQTLREAEQHTGRSRHLVFTTGITFLTTTREVWDETTPPAPDNPLYVRAQAEQDLAASGMPHTIVRPSFIYGGSARSSKSAQWFTDARNGHSAFYGDVTKRYSWVHVDDLAAAYVAILERPEVADGNIFMFGDEHQPKLLSVQQACLRVAGYTGDITFQSAQSGGMLESCADRDELVTSEKAQKLLGWSPRHPGILEDTLTYYAAWDRARPAG